MSGTASDVLKTGISSVMELLREGSGGDKPLHDEGLNVDKEKARDDTKEDPKDGDLSREDNVDDLLLSNSTGT